MRQAFHRIRVHPENKDLTTFRTRYGAYRYKVLPFRLTNRPSTFQRYINNTLFDYFNDFYNAYIDNILIYSDNLENHRKHIKLVLQRLRDVGLQADIKKSEFYVTKTKFLGYIMSTKGMQVDPAKVKVVRDWEPPTTIKSVQSFLRFYNFYRKFVRDYSRVAAPLNRLTKKNVLFE
ncbi:peptidase [Xylaria longipes]|nr:peptidase [Xylaria longipes]